MRRIGLVVVLLAGLPRAVPAHVVPIPPSVCDFEPIDFDVPGTGETGAALAPGTADALRIVYDAPASQIQVCPALADPDQCGSPVPRGFALGSTTGTLTFPALFVGHMLASGDVILENLPVTISVGTDASTAAVTFTTGLATVDGQLLEGTPLQGLASFTLVGVAAPDALPPPLAGRPLVVTMSCLPRPVPDKDQFALAPAISAIGGNLMHGKGRLRATVEVFSSALPDFAAHATMLAVHADGQPIASAVFSAGLHGSRILTATSDDGLSMLDLRQRSGSRATASGGQPSTVTRFAVKARLGNVVLPAQTSSRRVLVGLTLDAAGLLGRGEQLFHASRNGKKLHS